MKGTAVTVTAAAGLAALPAVGGPVVAATVAVVLIVTGAVCWAVADAARAQRLVALIRATRGLPPDDGSEAVAAAEEAPKPIRLGPRPKST